MHIEAVGGSAKLANGVHRDDGVADIHRANAVGGGEHGTNGGAAARIAVVVKGLVGHVRLLANGFEDGRAACGGGVGLAVVDLENRSAAELDLECGILQGGIGGMRCVSLVCREEHGCRQCAVLILCRVAELFANAVDDLHERIASCAAVGARADLLVVEDEGNGVCALGVGIAKAADDGVRESTVVKMRNGDEFLLRARKAAGGDIVEEE